jgi:hypothetical protein
MNSTGTKHHFSKGGGQPEKKVDKKNKTSQIWKSGEASQLNLDNEILEGGSQPEKNPVKLETL